MTFAMSLDVFGTRGSGDAPEVESGAWLFVRGWAADPATGRIPASIVGLIDGKPASRATMVVRHDVSKHFGNPALSQSGFDLGCSTASLTLGRHEFRIVFEDADGTAYEAGRKTFDVVPTRVHAGSPRILIAGAPKSGSSYTWVVLRKYFETIDPPLATLARGWEPNLEDFVVQRLRGRSFVLGMHIKGYDLNLATMRAERIAPIVTWRNLGDTIVSLDDHILAKDAQNWVYFLDRDKYAALPDQRRYQYLIRYAMPWYVGFYLSWKFTGIPIYHYERLAADPSGYFTEIVRSLTGSVDRERLASILAQGRSNEDNRNVGINSRSLTNLSDESKSTLEELLEQSLEPVNELVAELPWRAKPD